MNNMEIKYRKLDEIINQEEYIGGIKCNNAESPVSIDLCECIVGRPSYHT